MWQPSLCRGYAQDLLKSSVFSPSVKIRTLPSIDQFCAAHLVEKQLISLRIQCPPNILDLAAPQGTRPCKLGPGSLVLDRDQDRTRLRWRSCPRIDTVAYPLTAEHSSGPHIGRTATYLIAILGRLVLIILPDVHDQS